jgi:hypothetical protein
VKRFLLFAGDSFYANGGCYDLIGDFEGDEEVKAAWISYMESRGDDATSDPWGHYLDTLNKEVYIIREGCLSGQSRLAPKTLSLQLAPDHIERIAGGDV